MRSKSTDLKQKVEFLFIVLNIAFVQEEKVLASLLSGATTVLLMTALRNEGGGQIML